MFLGKRVENGGGVCKKWTFPRRRVHCVQYQYFLFHILLIWGSAYAPNAYGPATLRHLYGRNVKYLPFRIVSLTGQVSARTPVHCQSQADIARTLSRPTNRHFYLGCMHRRRSRGGAQAQAQAHDKRQCTNQPGCRRLCWSQFAGACLECTIIESMTSQDHSRHTLVH